MKNYFLILLSVAGLGIMADNVRPDTIRSTIAASSEIAVTEENPTLPKISQTQAKNVQDISSNAKITTISTARTASHGYAASNTSIPNYRVTIYSGEIISRNLSYNDIYKTKKLIYGHNSSNLLGSLKNLSIGSTFTITENGSTSTYQVADVRIFHKSDNYTLDLCNSGYNNCNGGSYYLNTLQNATFRGKNYDVALFTCDGTSLGGGDATHRRVVFAYQV